MEIYLKLDFSKRKIYKCKYNKKFIIKMSALIRFIINYIKV